jgi:uncharacterized protein (DUF486 family)
MGLLLTTVGLLTLSNIYLCAAVCMMGAVYFVFRS